MWALTLSEMPSGSPVPHMITKNQLLEPQTCQTGPLRQLTCYFSREPACAAILGLPVGLGCFIWSLVHTGSPQSLTEVEALPGPTFPA